MLAAESAATLLARDADGAAAELERVQALAREAMDELRSLIFELRPASLEAEGLLTTLRKHVDVLRRVSGQDVVLRVDGAPRLPPDAESEVLRVAQEALQNAVRHAGAARIEVRVGDGDGRLVLEVRDDGAGFDPAAPGVRSRRLGLTSMRGARGRARRGAADRVGAGRGDARAPGGARRVIRVLIADDHAVVRQGLRTFLDLQDDIEVVGEAADGAEAVDAAARLRARRRADGPARCRGWTASRRSARCASARPARA